MWGFPPAMQKSGVSPAMQKSYLWGVRGFPPQQILSINNVKEYKRGRGRPRKSKKDVNTKRDGNELIERLLKEAEYKEESYEEEEEIKVRKLILNGETYYKSEKNVVYNKDSEEIGMWNELKGEIE